MPRQISEELTHKEMIDPSIAKHSGQRPQLEQAGWYLRHRPRVKIEIPVERGSIRLYKFPYRELIIPYKDLRQRLIGNLIKAYSESSNAL